nr:protein bric-a-brac 1-like isoform X1 [Onthophagus taurus]XP_022918168.1 protein bric-a-brac 1-like isoform X1 [Onthophagus taurus]
MTMQQYCLKWNNHQPNFISVFSSLLNSESLVDVTLSAEGRHVQAHKLVLSACSSYFQSLFTMNPCQHPIVILKDVKFTDLKVMVDFMYYGEVNVSQEQLPHILKTAEMLKIKGLAEVPMESSLSRHNNSLDRSEMLPTNEGKWSSDGQRQSMTPSPCPLSPGTKRKRLRKSSTGSGSGSTERVSEEQQDCNLTSPTNTMLGTVIKPDPGGFTTEPSTPQRIKQHSSDLEIHRSSSHESENEPTHQITLQIPQQDVNVQHNIESSGSLDMTGPFSSSSQTISERPTITTHAQLPQQSIHQNQLGTKRSRFLIRQPRIKRESDPSQPIESDPLSPHYLTVPHVRVERQCSDPLPVHSPPPGSLLSVPGNVLVKQHSHPLLPSQTQQSQTPPAPLHIQLLPQTHSSEGERSISPMIIFSDPLATSPKDTPTRSESFPTETTATLRVRTDELRRSASSPQTGTRSSHCPVIRAGAALGCNYCWNTVDTHGRILRRKTKYHCPECRTNLCIVPCFQEYHERQASNFQTDPMSLTTSVMKAFPKTSSI